MDTLVNGVKGVSQVSNIEGGGYGRRSDGLNSSNEFIRRHELFKKYRG